MRTVTLITFVLLLGVAYGLYQLKYQVEGLQGRADSLVAQMEDDKRTIKVLEAEWAYLTRPQRLQSLSARFLELAPVSAPQIGALEQIPIKPVEGLEPAEPIDDSETRGTLSEAIPPMPPVDPIVDPPTSVSYIVDGGAP